MPGTHASVFSIYRSTIQEGRRFGFRFPFWGMENELDLQPAYIKDYSVAAARRKSKVLSHAYKKLVSSQLLAQVHTMSGRPLPKPAWPLVHHLPHDLCQSRLQHCLTSVERALKTSLSPPEIRDVHLYAFSRRVLYSDGAIRIDCPQPILAIGSILKETEHFSKLLTSGFSETNPEAPNAIRQYAHESEYDYETDSDLDEFEEADSMPSPVSGSSSSNSSRSKGKGKSKDDGEMGEEDKGHVQSQGVDHTKAHQILIPSIAHRTLKACVFYLYTGKTNFLPLTSEGASQRAFALLTTSESAAPACSPKSMFRLAESYGMSDLQDLAYDGIVSRLKPENIVEEAFSSFFARYDRLREHAVSYLSQHYSDRAVQNDLSEIIQRIVAGNMPHAGGVLQSLLGLRVSVAAPIPFKRPTTNASSIFSAVTLSHPAPAKPDLISASSPTVLEGSAIDLAESPHLRDARPCTPRQPEPSPAVSVAWGGRTFAAEAATVNIYAATPTQEDIEADYGLKNRKKKGKK
ncbi:hypothetical protein OH76DRAFT_123004 [Lentinus brumalis]|uniref:BTB domain-containing protein n=1 Tax=Lentinus brumalis TaxID=2498619 RepID=A0A371DJN2_9APHY|nr:hypothetical protein OH76DRAFT_123004 [Polyporus brumalis]